ncbi:unnamed protein product, partial [marine sediment metagenome]
TERCQVRHYDTIPRGARSDTDMERSTVKL